MADVWGPGDSHQVGGTGPQGCEPGADVGVVAAKMLKIIMGKPGVLLQPFFSLHLLLTRAVTPCISLSCPSTFPISSLMGTCKSTRRNPAGVCHGLADVFCTLGK